MARPTQPKPPCKVPGCLLRSRSKGLCSPHYQTEKRTGSATTPRQRRKGPFVKLTLRVTVQTKQALEEAAERAGNSPYEQGNEVMEEWGDRWLGKIQDDPVNEVKGDAQEITAA